MRGSEGCGMWPRCAEGIGRGLLCIKDHDQAGCEGGKRISVSESTTQCRVREGRETKGIEMCCARPCVLCHVLVSTFLLNNYFVQFEYACKCYAYSDNDDVVQHLLLSLYIL